MIAATSRLREDLDISCRARRVSQPDVVAAGRGELAHAAGERRHQPQLVRLAPRVPLPRAEDY